jgi:hypothetical protein
MKKLSIILLALVLIGAVPCVNLLTKDSYAKTKKSKKSTQQVVSSMESSADAKEVVPVAKKEHVKPLIIDDFEDGNYTQNPEWWKFDRIFLSVVKNSASDKSKMSSLGNYSLLIEGSTTNWYVGGFGTYIGKDASPYTAVRMMVYGNGPGSGLLKIELYDDDNGNWEIETNPKTFQPLRDDKFGYTLDVNWTGWKAVTIPFYDFEDENPKIGNDKFDPNQLNGSGGLLQMQIIALSAGKAIGKVDIKIDSISLVK